MNTEQAIETLIGFSAIMTSEDSIKAFEMALSALRAQQEREEPKPLTLEELMERDGKPVFIVSGDKNDYLNGWFIVCASIHEIETDDGIDMDYDLALFDSNTELQPEQAFYGKKHILDERYGTQLGLHLCGWLAFDYEPKSGDTK